MLPTHNLHVKETVRLAPPRDLKTEFPMTEAANQTVVAGRNAISSILRRTDPRLLVVVGPCSIHEPRAHWNTPSDFESCKRNWPILTASSCAFILRNRARPSDGKGSFTIRI